MRTIAGFRRGRASRMALMAAVFAMWGVSARAAELPGCNDTKTLHTVRMQYDMAEQAMNAGARRSLASIVEIREVSTGAPPAAANQYATKTNFIELSRYCEANAKLEAGGSEPVFWRIDLAKDGSESRIRVEYCSNRHDAFKDGCKWFRPGS